MPMGGRELSLLLSRNPSTFQKLTKSLIPENCSMLFLPSHIIILTERQLVIKTVFETTSHTPTHERKKPRFVAEQSKY